MATATFKHGAETWDYTPVAATSAGDVVLLGDNDDVLGVAVADIEAAQLGAVYVEGVFEFTTAVTDFSQGDAAYYNSSSETITETATDKYAGRVVSQPTSTTVRVSINMSSEYPSAS